MIRTRQYKQEVTQANKENNLYLPNKDMTYRRTQNFNSSSTYLLPAVCPSPQWPSRCRMAHDSTNTFCVPNLDPRDDIYVPLQHFLPRL